MSRGLATNVPCPECGTTVQGWRDGEEDTACPWGGPQGNAIAQPCGHTLVHIWNIWKDALANGRITAPG